MARGTLNVARIRARRGTAMRGASFSRSILGAVAVLTTAYACSGPGFKGNGGDNAGDEGGETAPGGGTSGTGGSAGTGGVSMTGGSAGRGGASTTGGTATSGGVSSGGRQQGGSAGDRAGSGATAASGAEGGAGTSGGRANGGASGAGASAGGANAAGRGGTGGSGGAGDCASALLCELCCDELYPDGHGNLAGSFYSCGCAQPCYSFCNIEFCGSAYYWSSECLSCLLTAPESSSECVAASNACADSALCQPYRACLLSCLQ
jgi:hypothetical protein